MINLELNTSPVVALLLLIDRECEGYSTEHAPQRIEDLRELTRTLDKKLDDHFDYQTSGK